MEIKEENNRRRIGSRFWVNSENKNFKQLTQENEMLFHQWGKSSAVLNDNKYSNKILKPINGYAMHFCPKPEVSTSEDSLILRYITHAEIWFDKREDGLYALDKTWQRQFYPSHLKVNSPKDCFNSAYKFYIPWLIDRNVTCELKEIKSSPIKLINKYINFTILDKNEDIWNCDWIHFFIKSEGSHIKEYNKRIYGIIEVGTPICDIIIRDKDIIKEFMIEHES